MGRAWPVQNRAILSHYGRRQKSANWLVLTAMASFTSCGRLDPLTAEAAEANRADV